MPSDPLSIVQEYLESPRPQIRRNAVTALGVMGAGPATQAIVRRAALDSDREVRSHAEDVLAHMSTGHASDVTAAVWAEVDDFGGEAPAYRLLGRLRSKGLAVSERRRGWRRRLKSVAMAGSLLEATSTWSIRFRPLLGGLAWGVGAAILLWILLHYTLRLDYGSEASVAIQTTGLLLGPLIAFAVSQRTNPIGLQFDYRAAMLIEGGRATIAGTIVGGIFTTLLLIEAVLSDELRIVHLLAAALFVGLAVGAVRIGTLASHGIARRHRLNRILQIASGTSAGLVTVGAVLLGVFLLVDEGDLFRDHVSAGAVLSVPVLVAAAAAFSWIDGKARGSQTSAPFTDRRVALAVTVLMSATVVLLVLSPARVVSGLRHDVDVLRATQAARPVARTDSIALGGELHFNVDFAQEVHARLPDENLRQGNDYVLEIVRDDGVLFHSEDDPPEIVAQLDPGRYFFRAYRYGERPVGPVDISLADIVPELEARLLSRMRIGRRVGREPAQRISIVYTLNSGVKNAVQTVQHLIEADSLDRAQSAMASYLAGFGADTVAAGGFDRLWTFAMRAHQSDPTFGESGRVVGAYAKSIWRGDSRPVIVARLDSTRTRSARRDTILADIAYLWGSDAIRAGDVDEALALYEHALVFQPAADVIDGDLGRTWNDLCWFGSLSWPVSAEDPSILARTWRHADAINDACELAVSLMPHDDPFIDGVRDSRGVIRVLAGDLAGARADFQAFVDSATSGQPDEKKQRSDWLGRLSQGEDPRSIFTPEVLRTLR